MILTIIYFLFGINLLKKYVYVILESYKNFLRTKSNNNFPPKKKSIENNSLSEKTIKEQSMKENKENEMNKNREIKILNVINNHNSNEIMIFSPNKLTQIKI